MADIKNWRPFFLAALGGVLQTLSWPRPGFWPLCLATVACLILAAHDQRGRRAFGLGWVYGMSLSLTSLPWIADVLAGYGGLGLVMGWLVTGLLAAILAVYPAVFAWLIAKPVKSFAAWALLGSAAWCGLDWLKNWLFTGFNWTPLAGPLALSPTMGQAADVFGFYGLGFFVALVNFLLAGAFLKRREAGWAKARPCLAAALALIVAGFAYGHTQFNRWERAAESWPVATVAAVQPSTEQTQKWDADYLTRLLAKYAGLAREAAAWEPWLVLWPETAFPFVFEHDYESSEWLRELSRETGGSILAGLAGVSGYWPEARLHNRMLLLHDGEAGAFYDKIHLVPFGEYVPFKDVAAVRWLFEQGLLGAAGSYSPGVATAPIEVPRHPDSPESDGVRLGVLICFESTFPYLGRARALEGAELLVVPTNDGWFGRSRAPEQHLYQSVMRAVETRRPLVRAGNTGISAVVRPSGRLTRGAELYDVGAFPLPTPLPGRANLTITFFVAWGYLLAPLTAGLTVLWVVARLFRGRKKDLQLKL
ncbi:MAG: apolipoprotein N-acyltransferase [Candidatus Adiutrix sp.]|jgi:apolipoprotein N-acyltransferase|nr:apolipoprotein N-acyltransferase [Candidatus Adiutrix sp.]